ncbi:MAG TPA: glycolate oxidase subunit GlcE [Steroidobacteraceae bacterium]|nr:glycolate oxidase subunit GlcE [Steroidobacteraceae bacterium]
MSPVAAVAQLAERIRSARAQRTPLRILGGATKSFYGEPPRGEPLDVRAVCGISRYEPTELFVTARAGTQLGELEQALAEQGQCLPFEPPRFAPGGTVGGMVAAGLSGPSRAAVGALRDYVLGVTMLNGRGDLMTFGGQVMKNVAGYDVSRLMAGSWGVLGVLCEVSLKVLAIPAAGATLEFDWDTRRALEALALWRAQPLPLHASAWYEERLRIRLSGARAAVASACRRLGGELIDPGAAASWWTAVRDHRHEFFLPSDAELAAGMRLWRISVPPTAPPLALSGRQFIEWGGALRWWRTAAPIQDVRAIGAGAGGHATLVRAADKAVGAFAPLTEPLMRIHRALKSAFDPDRILNPGSLYADL